MTKNHEVREIFEESPSNLHCFPKYKKEEFGK